MKRKAQSLRKSAWERAREYGIDMEALAANLKRTPAERIARHNQALATIMALRDGMRLSRQATGLLRSGPPPRDREAVLQLTALREAAAKAR